MGEIENGEPNGQGTLNSTYGKYVGEFKNVKENGQGTYNYTNGRNYVGRIQGQKTLEWKMISQRRKHHRKVCEKRMDKTMTTT